MSYISMYYRRNRKNKVSYTTVNTVDNKASDAPNQNSQLTTIIDLTEPVEQTEPVDKFIPSDTKYEENIRVGTITYYNGHPFKPLIPEGFSPVEVMTPSTAYGPISPYSLVDEEGRYMENLWQFAKIYKRVPQVIQKYSRYNHTIIWEHPAEVHVRKGKPTKKYWDWREKGMSNAYAVRYPVGYDKDMRASCLCSLYENDEGKYEALDYIEARKKIYLKLYREMVRKTEMYQTLLNEVRNGKKIVIMEVDGPVESSQTYYKTTYNLKENFINGNSMQANKIYLRMMLNDEKHPFGHGYCLAWALLEDLYGHSIDTDGIV